MGINSAHPQARLDVEGNVYFGSGNVGISTSSSRAKLAVGGGDIILDNDAGIYMKDSSGNPVEVLTYKTVGTDDYIYMTSPGAMAFRSASAGHGQILFTNNGNVNLYSVLVYPYSSPIFIVRYGNVGVGTTSPYAKFQVDGTLYFPTTTKGNVGIGSVLPRGAIDVDGAVYGSKFYGDGSTFSGVVVTGELTMNYVPRKNSAGVLVDSDVYNSSGNVGVGSASPASALEVLGDVNFNNNIVISNTDNQVVIDLAN